MLINANALADDLTLRSDICIIGAGPAGITLLKELSKTQLSVSLLESGDSRFNKTGQSTRGGESVGRPYVPLQRSRGSAFGGTSNLWDPDLGLRCHPLEEIDFEARPWVQHSGWPFDRAHMQPYYQRAHDLCELGAFDYDASERSDVLGASSDQQFSTTLFKFAKTDIFRNQLAEFEGAKNVNLVVNATVLGLEVDDGSPKIARARATTASGRNVLAEADTFVLATGGIDNARLLLLSNTRYPQGIGNQNDLVGRFFMEHLHLNSGYLVPQQVPFQLPAIYPEHKEQRVKTVGALVVAPDAQRTHSIGNFSAFIHLTSAASRAQGARSLRELAQFFSQGYLSSSVFGHLANVLRDPIAVARMVRDRLTKREASLAELTVMAEQLPDPESRVTLSSKLDQFGRPKPKLDWQLSDQDLKTIRLGQGVIDQELRSMGLARLVSKYDETSPPPTISGGMHHMGTTRMSADPKQGVVDADCKVHGIPNLFVAGSSVFPTGGYANPTLTVIALSMRLADHLKARSVR
jgi:choline dehydrogenase-like flavoprotein